MDLLSFPKSLLLMAFFWAITLFLTSFTIPFALGFDCCGGRKLSAYEVLEEYNFPVGLLPVGVSGYEFNRETGEFSAYLNKTCQFPVESYTLEYNSPITGVLSEGKLSNLKGVRVFVILLWINIVEVIRDGDELDFSVGIASANFPIDNFEECPRCGCGLDCVNKLKQNGIFSY